MEAISKAQMDQRIVYMNYKPPFKAPPNATLKQGGVLGTAEYQQFKWQVNHGVINYVLPVDITKQLLRGEEVSDIDIGIEMAGMLPLGKIFSRVGKILAKSEFGEAALKELGTFFKNNANEGSSVVKKRLIDSVESHNKLIAKHEQWIADPKAKYGDKWDTFSEQRKSNEIHHWKQDIKRNEAYRDAKQKASDEIE